jgi:hypothetical protein
MCQGEVERLGLNVGINETKFMKQGGGGSNAMPQSDLRCYSRDIRDQQGQFMVLIIAGFSHFNLHLLSDLSC